MLGAVSLQLTLQARPFSTPAYVLHGKGPSLILGFPFLEAQGLMVDCEGRQLLPKSEGQPVQCLPSTLHPTPAVVRVKRFRIDGLLPPLPCKKYQADAEVDLFAPRSIHIRPGQRALVDTGLACAFPRNHWCLLKDKSSLALRHGLTVLGGVVDSNYRGRIQVILHNLGSRSIDIPRGAPMCQAVLLPQQDSHFQEGPVDMTTDRGASASMFRPGLRPSASSGKGFQRVSGPPGTRF